MKKAGKTIIAVCLSLMCVCFSFYTVPSSFNMTTVSAVAYSTEPSSYATIKKGSQGYSVKAMQTMLNAVTGAGLSVDGIFGIASYNALCSYQRAEKLTVDGICGKDTWTALCSAYGAGASRSIANGTYTVASSLNSNRVIDCIHSSKEDDANVILYDNAETDNQHIQITFLGNGYYSIIFVHSGKSIDMNRETHNVTQWGFHGGKNQMWAIYKYGEQYAIVNRESGLYLDLQAGNPINEANIQVYKSNNTKAQRWYIRAAVRQTSVIQDFVDLACSYEGKTASSFSYASIYDNPTQWCAPYISFLSSEMGISEDIIPRKTTCYSDDGYMPYYQKKGWFEYSQYHGGNYSPQVGDLIFYDWDSNKDDADHIGIICSVNGNTITVIEGNYSNKHVVGYRTVYKTYSCITGYAVLHDKL